MSQSNCSYTIANIRIARYLDAYDDYERRKAEADAAKQRLDKAIAALTEYDQKVFECIVKGYTNEDELHATHLD